MVNKFKNSKTNIFMEHTTGVKWLLQSKTPLALDINLIMKLMEILTEMIMEVTIIPIRDYRQLI